MNQPSIATTMQVSLRSCSRVVWCATLTALLVFAPRAQAQNAAAPAAAAPVVKDSVARALIDTNPSSPSNIVRVMVSLVDLREPAAAGDLLKKLNGMVTDDAGLTALFDEFGSTVFMRFARQPAMNPAATELVGRLRAAVAKRAADPAHIAKQIELLKNNSPAVRAAAIGQLQLGGIPTVQLLLQALADPAQAAAHFRIREALVAFGDDALPTLVAAIGPANDAQRLQIINVLGEMTTPAAEPYLYFPAFVADAPEDLRAAAQRGLQLHRSTINSPAAAALSLIDRARQIMAQRTLQPAQVGQAVGWADDARSILPLSPTVRNAQLSIAITAAPVQEAVSARLEGLDAAALESLLAESLERNDGTVATWAAWGLGQRGTNELLHNRGAMPSVLVQATRYPDSRVRMAAIEAIGRLNPVRAFPGSSQVADAVDYLLRSRGVLKAISGDLRTSFAGERAGLLATVGYEGEMANEARRVIELLWTMPDCELIVLDFNIASPLSGQLLGSLRRDLRSAQTPIVIVATTDQLTRAEALARHWPQMAAVLDVRNAQGIELVAATARKLGEGRSVPAADRLPHAERALAWLATHGGDANSVFPLRRFEPVLIEALASRALITQAAPLVARCATARGQRALADAASESAQPLELRQAAAAALVEGITRYGTLLTIVDLRQQYDRYNNSQRDEKAVQEMLASILDVVEQRAGLGTEATRE